MGRGMGRILGSLTLLTQYIGSASGAAKKATNAAQELSAAYEREALKQDMAAIAAAKKSAALAVEAEMEGLENDATIAASDANAAEAVTARLAAAALRQKAAAAAADAAAETALAESSATASMGMVGMIAVFALLLAIIGEVYVIYKSLVEIIGESSRAQLEAAEYADAHRLAVWEEVEALDKLKEASEKTSEAIKKMNEAKDNSVELTKEKINASKNEADALAKLYDAQVKNKLLDVEMAEKKGQITPEQAAQKKAEIESKAIADKEAAKQKQLDEEAKTLAAAAEKAKTEKDAAQKNFQASSDKVNKSPEGQKLKLALAQAEKDLSAAKSEAQKAEKEKTEYNKGGHNFLYNSSIAAYLSGYTGFNKGSTQYGMAGVTGKTAALNETAEATANAAASAQMRLDSLKRFSGKSGEAVSNESEAHRVADEKTRAATTLDEMARKAKLAAAEHAKNSPAEVAAQQANIAKQAQIEQLSGIQSRGYSLNNQQRIGAYAATPPEWKQQLELLRGIRENTSHMKPAPNSPPGTRKPQVGPSPKH
jgi:hypothetical protein